MISKEDMKYMRDSQRSIRKERTNPVILKYTIVTGLDPVTDEEVTKKVEYEVDAVVTVISVRTAVERYMEQGIKLVTGDIVIDVDIDDMPPGVIGEDIEYIEYDDINYVVVSNSKLGLTEYKRNEFVVRRER